MCTQLPHSTHAQRSVTEESVKQALLSSSSGNSTSDPGGPGGPVSEQARPGPRIAGQAIGAAHACRLRAGGNCRCLGKPWFEKPAV